MADSKRPPMFHPEGEFDVVGAVLARVNAVVSLGDEAFPEFAPEDFIALLQDVPQGDCVTATGGVFWDGLESGCVNAGG